MGGESAVANSIIGWGHHHIFMFCTINLFLKSIVFMVCELKYMNMSPQLSNLLRHCEGDSSAKIIDKLIQYVQQIEKSGETPPPPPPIRNFHNHVKACLYIKGKTCDVNV